ncbi:MAG: hypothetical protein IJJ40_05960 [Clostridia bacterium]|nr:hypothetical protein [Clostridia bacterium]
MNKSIKRIFALILCVAMLLAVAGCGSNDAISTPTRKLLEGESEIDGDDVPSSGFRVGYGRTDIMPDDSIPLGSYGNAMQRFSTGYLNKIFFSCIAITDDSDKTMLLMSWDFTQCKDDYLKEFRQYAKNKYGIDENYVHLSGTHTHSSGDLGLASSVKSVQDHSVKVYQRAHEAIDMAMADRKAAEMYAGETKTDGLNFVRNYYRADGTTAGDNWGYIYSSPVVSHVKDPDETMRIIKFTRKNSDGEKVKDVVLVNWQAHNHMTGGSDKTDLAADFSGAFRTSLEKERDCYMTFFQGCAGNLNEKDTYFPENNKTEDYREYGKLLADTALKIYDKLEKYSTEAGIKSETKEFEGEVNHTFDGMYDKAVEVMQEYNNSGKQRSAILDLCRQYNMPGCNAQASCIIKYYTTDKTKKFLVNAYQIGEIGWTSAGVEFFDVLGERIRKGSPYKLTFTQGYTDQSTQGYLPYADAYDYGCYEVCNSPFNKGVGEQCADFLIEMLKELKSSK